MQRATVHLKVPAHVSEEHEGSEPVHEEWCHADELEEGEVAVILKWRNGLGETVIPWSNVARIDFDPCDCMDCSPEVPA